MTLNPFRAWSEYRIRQAEIAERIAAAERLERRQEREAFLAAVTAMTSLSEKAFEANRAQNETFRTFIDGFKVTEAPTYRGYDESEADKKWLTDHGYGVPKELEGLSQMEQFQALLDRLDS